MNKLITNKLKTVDSNFLKRNSDSVSQVLASYDDYATNYKSDFFNVRGPSSIDLHELKDVFLIYSASLTGGRAVSLYTEDGRIIDCSTGSLPTSYFQKAVNEKDYQVIDECAFAADRFTGGNMCHVLYDHICRANRFIDLGFEERSIYLLDSSWSWAKKLAKELIGDLSYLEEGKLYKVNKLYITSNALNGKLLHPTIQHSPEFISLLKAYRDSISSEKESGRKLYINRLNAKARKIKNEQEIIDYLSLLGFKSHDTSSMLPGEQLETFNQSDIVISPHGAALTNLFACKPGTRVYEFFSGKGTKAYEVICTLFDLDYTRIDLKKDKGLCDFGKIKNINFDRRDQINKKKIFQIGFNKSGTVSIHKFFEANGIKSVHWDRGRLSKTISNNKKNNKLLLTGYEEFQAFSDMEHRENSSGFFYSAEEFYKELDEQYPDSIFILNYRDLESWIKSRINHGAYLYITMRDLQLSRSEVLRYWKKRYVDHIESCKEYFKEKDNFLLLEMKPDNMMVLGDFLASHNFNIISNLSLIHI